MSEKLPHHRLFPLSSSLFFPQSLSLLSFLATDSRNVRLILSWPIQLSVSYLPREIHSRFLRSLFSLSSVRLLAFSQPFQWWFSHVLDEKSRDRPMVVLRSLPSKLFPFSSLKNQGIWDLRHLETKFFFPWRCNNYSQFFRAHVHTCTNVWRTRYSNYYIAYQEAAYNKAVYFWKIIFLVVSSKVALRLCRESTKESTIYRKYTSKWEGILFVCYFILCLQIVFS